MRARADERRNPGKAAEHALHWGLPILESAITLIAEGHIYYRGRDAAELARTSSLADVAALLWTGSADGGAQLAHGREARRHEGPRRRRSRSSRVRRRRSRSRRAKDPLGYDLRPRAVAQTGWRILQALATVAANGGARESTIDATLAKAWGVPRRCPAAARRADPVRRSRAERLDVHGALRRVGRRIAVRRRDRRARGARRREARRHDRAHRGVVGFAAPHDGPARGTRGTAPPRRAHRRLRPPALFAAAIRARRCCSRCCRSRRTPCSRAS